MYSNLFSAQSVQDLMTVLPSLPYAIWETFYMTVLRRAAFCRCRAGCCRC